MCGTAKLTEMYGTKLQNKNRKALKVCKINSNTIIGIAILKVMHGTKIFKKNIWNACMELQNNEKCMELQSKVAALMRFVALQTGAYPGGRLEAWASM